MSEQTPEERRQGPSEEQQQNAQQFQDERAAAAPTEGDMATSAEEPARPDSVSENYDDRNEAAEDPDNATPVQSREENVVEGAEGEGREAKPGGMNPVSSTEDRGESAPQGSLPGV